MKMSRIIVGVVVFALSSQLAWSQEARPSNAHSALGILDSATQAFKAGQMADFDSSSVAATNAQTGTIVVNFTITIRSAIPTTTPILCDVSASVTEISAPNVIEEEAAVAATRTGSTAKCTVTIPYSWVVLNPVTARFGLAYSLIAAKTTPGTTGLLSRASSGIIALIPIPANGGTTTQTVNAVL